MPSRYDVKAIFDETGAGGFASGVLAGHLASIEGSPWGDWRDKPLTAHGLAKLLGRYTIRPRQHRTDEDSFRGYLRTDFEDAWSRYLTKPDDPDKADQEEIAEPIPEPPPLPGASATVQQVQQAKPNKGKGCCTRDTVALTPGGGGPKPEDHPSDADLARAYWADQEGIADPDEAAETLLDTFPGAELVEQGEEQ